MWSAPSKSRFYYLFWLLELMPGHLRRSILRILVLNPTHEISWSRSGFFSLRGRILRAGPPGPFCFLVFVSSPPPSALQVPGRPLNERLKTLRPVRVTPREAVLGHLVAKWQNDQTLWQSGHFQSRTVQHWVRCGTHKAPIWRAEPNAEL